MNTLDRIIDRLERYYDRTGDVLTLDQLKQIRKEHHAALAELREELTSNALPETKSEMEEIYTSTGSKFWHHRGSLIAYQQGTGHTIISTHISPEGMCNLVCSYCSVANRSVTSRLELSVIQQYVRDLKTRGLKAVILTGGGEPTLYPEINELLEFLYAENLKVGLITNGTRLSNVELGLLRLLTWIRISINVFPGWRDSLIFLPDLSRNVTLGLSYIYAPHTQPQDLLSVLQQIKLVADRVGAKYVRVLPNCLLSKQKLVDAHIVISNALKILDDSRFFHQRKISKAPDADVCHQSFFRPYLSEEPFLGETEPGSVFPCDSVVLNSDRKRFIAQFALCKPNQVLDYLDGKIKPKFNPRDSCTGCAFTNTVNMLERFKCYNEDHFKEFKDVEHVEFV